MLANRTTLHYAPGAPLRSTHPLGSVLVVDDAGARRDDLACALRAEGFDVHESECGEPAVEAAAFLAPDAVVLDLCHPDVAGPDFCHRLKAAVPGLLPVLHVSYGASPEVDSTTALDAGADACILPPLHPHALRAAIGALVRLARRDAERSAAAAVNAVVHGTLDALADHVALLGPTAEVVAVNKTWADFAHVNGYAEGGTGLGANYADVCDRASGDEAEYGRETARQLRRVLADEIPSFELEYPCHSPAEERWFRLVVRRVPGTGPVAAIVTHTAVTQQRLAARAAADALMRAERDRRRLETTLEAIPVGVWIADATGMLTHTNAAAARIWGGKAPLASAEDGYSVYKGWWLDTGAEIAPGEWALAQTVRTGKAVLEQVARIQRFDGTLGHTISSSAPILDADGQVTGAIAVSTDVSERVAAMGERTTLLASLELERARLALIFEQSPSFLAVIRGPDYVFERVNPAYRRLIGDRDVVGLPLLVALPEIRGQGFVELLDQVAATGESIVVTHMPAQLAVTPGAPPETRYVDMVFSRILDADGGHAIVALGIDVTDTVLAVEELQKSKDRLRDQFAKLPVPTFLWEARGDTFELIDANEAAYRTFPRLGKGTNGLVAHAGSAAIESLNEDRRRCLRENVVVRRSLEFDVGAPMGLRSFDVMMGPQQPDRVLVHWVDTTERVQLEAQLRQSQKLEAIGQLAGGIAHDFNNLLTVIVAYAGLLLEELPTEDEARLSVIEIEHAARRATDLTRQLLSFSRKELVATRAIDINAAVRGVGQLLPRLIGSDVDITFALADEPLTAIGESGQVGQILMNLVVNANDAMPRGGTIRIETARVEIDDAFVQAHPDAGQGSHIRLRVVDTGHGMDPETRMRVFEPFFTTKAPGKGTGLGLSAVYGIVQQWGGFVHVWSEVGSGTAINIYLPVVDAPVSGPSAQAVEDGHADVRPAEESTTAHTVLLVDDDDAVRGVVCRVLRTAGYQVIEASNGIDALRLLDDSDQAVDVVLSDMVMPGMGGRDLAYEVRIRHPNATLVLMSGYTRELLAQDDPLRHDTVFMQKPFTPDVVLRAIRDALAARRGRNTADARDGVRVGTGGDRRALDALINGVDAIVWEADATSSRFHYISRRAESLLGYPRERWHVEGFWTSIVHPDDRDRVLALRQTAVIKREGFSADYRLIAAGGATHWIRDAVCVVPGNLGSPAELGGVMFDITEAKESMLELMQAKEAAEYADAAKSEFIKLVSHELHTPLNAVIGFAKILQRNRQGNLSAKDLSYIERIAANGEQLLAIVRDVLDVTRMEAGTLEVTVVPVALATLVTGLASDLEGAALDKHITLSAVVPPALEPVLADPLRLRQVLTNLIGNAIKYTDAGSVVVRVVTANGRTPAAIEITDTGPGIPADRLDKIFDVFYQEESFTKRRHSGAGMGLGIARGLCERMGFTLSLRSVVGEGSTFVIDLVPDRRVGPDRRRPLL